MPKCKGEPPAAVAKAIGVLHCAKRLLSYATRAAQQAHPHRYALPLSYACKRKYHMSSGCAASPQYIGSCDTGWSYSGKITVLLAAAFYTINLMTNSQRCLSAKRGDLSGSGLCLKFLTEHSGGCCAFSGMLCCCSSAVGRLMWAASSLRRCTGSRMRCAHPLICWSSSLAETDCGRLRPWQLVLYLCPCSLAE